MTSAFPRFEFHFVLGSDWEKKLLPERTFFRFSQKGLFGVFQCICILQVFESKITPKKLVFFAIRIDSYIRFECLDTHSTTLGRFRRFPQVQFPFGKSYGEHRALQLSNLSQFFHFEKKNRFGELGHLLILNCKTDLRLLLISSK